jgi:hypothetical protein
MSNTLSALKQDLLKLKTVVQTVVISVLGGAASSALGFLQNSDKEATLFTHAGLVKLSHQFAIGAVVSFVSWLVPSPLKTLLSGQGTQPAPEGK